jgi:hypothetical protein
MNASVLRSSSNCSPLKRIWVAAVNQRGSNQVSATPPCTLGTAARRCPAIAGVATEPRKWLEVNTIWALALKRVAEARIQLDLHSGGANRVGVLALPDDRVGVCDSVTLAMAPSRLLKKRVARTEARPNVVSTPPSTPLSVSGSSSGLALVIWLPTAKRRCSSLSVGVRLA